MEIPTQIPTDYFPPENLTGALTVAEALATAANWMPHHCGYLLECSRASDPEGEADAIGWLDLSDARSEAERGGDLFGGSADPVVRVRVTVLLGWHGYDCACDSCLIENGRYVCGDEEGCGYDWPEVDGDTCPECQHARKPRSDD